MKKGFTLIELLIVISIIGILAVALLPNILSAPATARDAGRRTSLNNVLTALEQYKATSTDYPLAAGTAAYMNDESTTTSLGSIMKQYFKGGAATLGAKAEASEPGIFGLTAKAAGTEVPVAYCKLPTSYGGGYSYVVAIRLEQTFSGPNAMDPAKVATECGSLVPGDFSAPGVNSKYYYLIQ